MDSRRELEALNHLHLLELEVGATIDDVKKSYKTLVKVWHPDRFLSDESLRRLAEEKLKRINEAYSWLTANQEVWFAGFRGGGATLSIPTDSVGKHWQSGPTPSSNSSDHTSDEPSTQHRPRKRVNFVFPGILVIVACLGIWAGFSTSRSGATSQPPPSLRQPVYNALPSTFPDIREGFVSPLSPSTDVTMPTAANTVVSPDTASLMPTLGTTAKALIPSVPEPSTTSEEAASIEAVCSQAKYLEGPAAYENCVSSQLNDLAAGPQRPDLSSLSEDEKSSVKAVCSSAKYLEGPADYNTCLTEKMVSFSLGAKAPDLSALSTDELSSIEAVCSQAKYLEGPAAYNACLTQQLELLEQGPRQPNLGMLSFDQRVSIESVCSQQKYLEGPSAYNMCLTSSSHNLSTNP